MGGVNYSQWNNKISLIWQGSRVGARVDSNDNSWKVIRADCQKRWRQDILKGFKVCFTLNMILLNSTDGAKNELCEVVIDMQFCILSKTINDTAANISAATGLGITPALICMILCCIVIYKITRKIIHIVFAIIVIAILFTLLNNLIL